MAERQIETIEIVGGHLTIDFVNTVSNWNSGDRTDFLGDYEDLVRFALRQELIGEKTAARFCGRPEAEREAALAEARRFRDSVHAILLARAEDRALPAEALGHLNALVRELVQWREIRAQGSGICCAWRFEDAPAQALLGPVAWETAELLEKGERDRVKVCPGERCGWLFLDTSRNRSRQWCSMKVCGNVAKVRRFRAKTTN